MLAMLGESALAAPSAAQSAYSSDFATTLARAKVRAFAGAAATPAPARPASSAAPASSTTTPASTATITGSVKSPGGSPIQGVRVTFTGPATAVATSDAAGAFTLTIAPGIYRVEASRGGYLPANLDSLAVTGDQPITITMTAADLSSLRTIGRVTVSRTGSQINTSAAAQTIVSAKTLADLANPQINNVLERSPDVTIQHMGSQPDTTIIVGGVQPYETQVLIDGHPLALGQYGVWLSQYFPSYAVGAIEAQSGPGNTTPFANLAVGGTANILTPSFTNKTVGEVQFGIDNYQTPSSHALFSGSVDKFQYVIGAGVDGSNGPYFGTKKCIVVPEAGGANDNTGAQTGVIQTCLDASGSFFNKGEILKLRYNFSPSTSLDLGFVGAWGGYNPQGTAWGTSLGPTKIVGCLANGETCNNPAYAGMIGSTIDGYGWYTGSSVYTNQTLYDLQLRTSIGKDTLLVRPYIAQISPEDILGGGEVLYPSFYGPVGAANNTANPDPNSPYNQFVTACGNAFGQLTSPTGAPLTVVNGQPECYNTLYQTYEIDKLYGSTFSYLHPFGDNLVALNYDFHGQSTFAFINNPAGVSVPFSTDRYSTFSLTGDFAVAPKLSLKTGLYDTQWTVIGVEPVSATDADLTGFKRTVSRFDPHVALTYRPQASTSVRAAWGTSATFPFVGQVSGLATYEQPAASLGPPYAGGGILTEKNPSLQPEVSTSYDIGFDHRFADSSLLSMDLEQTLIHNVFEPLTTTIANPLNGQPEGVFSPANVARLNSQVLELKYEKAPLLGLGYNVSAAAERAIVQGLPAGAAQFPVNGVQICGNGVQNPGIPTCIPYLKGYVQVNYTMRDGSYLALGGEYQGKNNAYFQPPFWIADLTARRALTNKVDFSLGVENLFNTNNYGTYLATPGVGTPIVDGAGVDAAGNQQLGSFVPTRISAPPRTLRLSVRLHTPR